MKKILLNFLSYLLALVLVLVIFAFMLNPEQLAVFRQITGGGIAIAMLLSLGAYLGNGLEYYVLYRNLGLRMEKKDILLLPLAMNLAGTVLPVQGAMLYQIFLCKKKYRFSIARSCAVTGMLYLITLLLSGLSGVVLALAGQGNFCFLGISLLFLLAPLLMFPVQRLFQRFSFRSGWLEKIRCFLLTAVNDVVQLLRNVRLTGLLVLIYLLRLLSMILMFSWIARCLHIEGAGFVPLLLLNFWNMLSLILKVTPNNLGISQMFSGLLFAMIGLSAQDGILLSFAATMVFIAVALTAGSMAMICHFWQFSKPEK